MRFRTPAVEEDAGIRAAGLFESISYSLSGK
jgi:hypothetical protein